jgi:hypothetical protein
MKIPQIKIIGELTPNCRKLLYNNSSKDKLEKVAYNYRKELTIAQKGEDLLLINSGAKTSCLRISETKNSEDFFTRIITNLFENRNL